MAACEEGVHLQKHAEELKYLGFVEAVHGVLIVAVVRVYEVAKEWSGSWRSGINELELKVRNAIAPFFYLIEGKEHQILLFFDHKLDVVVCAVQKYAPHVLKDCCGKVVDVAKKVPDFAVEFASEVHRVGVIDTTRGYFNKFEPLAEEWMHLAWKQYLKLPFSLTLVHVASPPAFFVGEKLNQLLSHLKAHKLPLVEYVPLLPLKRIETILKKEE
eukprot:c16889_g1_i1 orf=395-1039(-)